MPTLAERFDHYAKDFFKEELFEKSTDFLPKVEIRENKKNYLIMAELPGIDVENIHLKLEDNCLIVEGHKYPGGNELSILSECQYGYFYRWIPLGEDVDNDRIQAKLNKGILKVILWKKKDGLDDYRKIKIIKS